MKVTYDIYRRYTERDRESHIGRIEDDIYYGKRYEMIQDFEKLSLNLYWGKQSKFSIKGNGTKNCPLEIGDTISIYRNTVLIFTGIVEDVDISCDDVTEGSYTWAVDGVDESVIFDWRQILIDYDPEEGFQDLTFDNDTYDKCEDYAFDRMVHYIRNCFDITLTMPERAIEGMIFPKSSTEEMIREEDRGKNELSAYRLKKLSTVLEEIGKEANLFAQYTWNPITGEKRVTIPIQRDLSGMDESKTYDPNELIVISPQFGNVSKWKAKYSFPKFNAVWVCSGDYDEEIEGQIYQTRVWVYAEDPESIKKYGRIENIVTKSDIKIKKDDQTTEEDETLTEEDVRELLEEEARKQLQDNAAKEKYTITLAQSDDFAFMDHWRCGDKVKVVIDGKQFASTIESVSIDYAEFTESVTPSIGTAEEGIFSEVFELISGIDKRLESQEGS